MALRAVFLDAGNTLIAIDYPVIAGRLAADGHRVTAARVRDAEQRARVRLDPHLAGAASTETVDTFELYLGYILDGLGVPSDGDLATLAADLRRAKPPLGLWSVPIPGIPELLARLRGRGLRLAVVSNSNGTVAELMRTVGFAGHLDAVIDSGAVGVEKPDPRIFELAAAALGVRPAEAVHVGDLYSVDVLGARAAGCRAILLDPVGAWPALDCPKAADLAAAVGLIEGMLDG